MRTTIPARRSRRAAPLVLLAVVALIAIVAACAEPARILSNVGNSVPAPEGPAASAASEMSALDAGRQEAAGGGSAVAFKDDAKIVRTGSMSLQVVDLDKALARARDAIRALGGYIGASTQANEGQSPTATITYRVPVDRWDDALVALRGIATKVLAERTDAVEVTGQLVDLAARIKNLQASEQALQGILEKATRIPDILEVQGQLTNVRGQIEQLTAQQALLQDQTSYGTITVTMGPEIVAVTQAARQWDPASEVDQAAARLVDILQAVASAGIWFGIVWLPVLLVLGAIALAVALGLRRAGLWRRPTRPEETPTLPTPQSAT